MEDPERGPYPVPRTQANDIDPRLQEATQNPQPYSNPPPQNPEASQFNLPLPPAHQQQQQHQQDHPQPQYAGPPQWQQDGYNQIPYYPIPPDQPGPPVTHPPQPHLPKHYYTYNTPSQPAEGNFGESKRTRACEACRGLKVRCEPDSNNGPCKRCAKANRNCVITAPSRKRQKKTDSRVAELERKIDALTAEVNATIAGNFSEGDDYEDGDTSFISQTCMTPQQHPSPYATSATTGLKRRMSEYQQDGCSRGPPSESLRTTVAQQFAPTVPNMLSHQQTRPIPAQLSNHPFSSAAELHSNEHLGVIDPGVLSVADEEEIFAHYIRDMVPHMPIVVFPTSTTCESVRRTTPVLFLAIMSVASAQDHPQIQVRLQRDIMAILGDRIFGKGEKSLELVQALQVVAMWYWPEQTSNSKNYQFVHTATTMAMDLGIDRKQGSKLELFLQLLGPGAVLPDTETAECRRAWLGCYLLASSIAMGKKRPSLVRPNAYLNECATNLSLIQGHVESDTVLVHWVKLQILADDLTQQISPDVGNIAESKVRTAYKAFEKQLKDWEGDNIRDYDSVALLLAFNVVKLYMQELTMKHEVCSEPPQKSRGRPKNQSHASPLPQVASPSTALVSTIGILDTFTKFSIQQIRTLPLFQFAQLAHASVSLFKMFFVSKSNPEFHKQAPITPEMIRQYMNPVIQSLHAASLDGKSRGASSFLSVFVTLQKLFEEHKEDTLESIKVRYGCLPGTKDARILDLEESTPTPQRRAVDGSGECSDGALHLLSEVATGNSGANGYKPKEAQMIESTTPPSVPAGDNMTTMGQLIGGEDLGSMSDDGFFGIMQTMWARST